MKWIISRYNHDLDYLKDYTDDFVLYDRSEDPKKGSIVVPNIGSDIYDKLTYIIDNYDNLPPIALYTKANIFKYIDKDEFEKIKDNKTFTPILSQRHEEKPGTCYYKDGMYYEINNGWYLSSHPVKNAGRINEVMELLGIKGMRYVPFAPGSNYILPKENILKHPKATYEKLREYLEWAVYPGEAQIIERGLYTLWS
jgi:hypothetical protein